MFTPSTLSLCILVNGFCIFNCMTGLDPPSNITISSSRIPVCFTWVGQMFGTLQDRSVSLSLRSELPIRTTPGLEWGGEVPEFSSDDSIKS